MGHSIRLSEMKRTPADSVNLQAQPDLISHNSAISSCEAAGEWEAALALLEARGVKNSRSPLHLFIERIIVH